MDVRATVAPLRRPVRAGGHALDAVAADAARRRAQPADQRAVLPLRRRGDVHRRRQRQPLQGHRRFGGIGDAVEDVAQGGLRRRGGEAAGGVDLGEHAGAPVAEPGELLLGQQPRPARDVGRGAGQAQRAVVGAEQAPGGFVVGQGRPLGPGRDERGVGSGQDPAQSGGDPTLAQAVPRAHAHLVCGRRPAGRSGAPRRSGPTPARPAPPAATRRSGDTPTPPSPPPSPQAGQAVNSGSPQ